jgi:hypothetical protein
MQLCGDCVQQVAQTGAALAPTLWLLALAAFTAVVAKGNSGGTKKGKGKGK